MTESLHDEPAPVEIVAAERRYDGAVWNIQRDTFRFNGGEITREYVDHTGAVAVLAMDEREQVLLIKQYRHPVRTRDWEIPAGLLDIEGEAPLAAAQRELAEEADLVASEWHVLAEFYTSPGGSNEAIRVYLARGLTAASDVFDREAEEADMELRWVTLDELVDAVLARRVQNPSLVIAAFAAQAARSRDWSTLGAGDEPWPMHPKAQGAER